MCATLDIRVEKWAIISREPILPQKQNPLGQASGSGRAAARSPGAWAAISAAGFIFSLLVTLLLYWGAPRITRYGLTRTFFFSSLIALGLCAAGFLFGALRSYAHYKAQTHIGVLELGGPVVVFLLVVLIGIRVAGPSASLNLVVRVHGPRGIDDTIRTGSILIDIGTDRRAREIGTNGEVQFNQIPISFTDQKILVIPQVPDYAPKNTSPVSIPSDGVIYVEVVPTAQSCEFRGALNYPDGRPVVRASLQIDYGVSSGNTNDVGEFNITVPKKCGETIQVTATLENRTGFNSTVTLPGQTTLRFDPK